MNGTRKGMVLFVLLCVLVVVSIFAFTAMMGDFFDYHLIGNRFLTGHIGDVAGHGAPASLLMAMAKGSVNALSEAERLEPELGKRSVNRIY